MLRISRGGRVEGMFYLPDEQVVIGRGEEAEIQLLDSRVSRRHAVIRKSVAGFMIQDLNTKNGTWVNAESIDKSLLFHGDKVAIGSYEMAYLEESADESLDSSAIDPLDEPVSSGSLSVPRALQGGHSRSSTIVDEGPPAVRHDRSERLPPGRSGPVDRSATAEGASVEFSMAELERVLDEIAVPGGQAPEPPRARSGPQPAAVRARRVQKPTGKEDRTPDGSKRPPWATSEPGDSGW